MQLLLAVHVSNSLVKVVQERKVKGEIVHVKDKETFLHPQRSWNSTRTLEPRIF